jgi:outer membrane protein
VGLTASVGVATSETDAQGAQFSAPGLGQSNGVAFSTGGALRPPSTWSRRLAVTG